MYTPTENDINILMSHNKNVQVDVTLLDENYIEIDNISGIIKQMNCDIDSSSNIRRTCSLTMSVPKRRLIDIDFENTWLRKMVNITCTVYDMNKGNFAKYNIGNMLMVSEETNFDATTQEIRMSLADLSCTISDSRGSQLGTDVEILVGEKIKNVLVETIETYFVYKKYSISDDFTDETVPYDITISKTNYPYDIIKKLLDLYPYYEAFYDVDGVYTIQPIPLKTDDPVDISADIIDMLMISEQKTLKFTDVKNSTEIWGKELTADYDATCTSDGSRYDLFIDKSFAVLVVNDEYMFVPDENCSGGQTIKIQDTKELPLVYENSNQELVPIEANMLVADTAYVIRYNGDKFVFEGQSNIHAIVMEVESQPSEEAIEKYKTELNCNDVEFVVNPESFFAVKEDLSTRSGFAFEIRQVLADGEYASIYTTDLALQRARYENWKTCRLNDMTAIQTLMIPWIDVNLKIQYHSPTSDELTTWVIQKASFDFSKWTMTIEAARFNPYYSWW